MRWSPIWRRPRYQAPSLGLIYAATAGAILLLFASILLLLGVIGFPTGASDSGMRAAGFAPVQDTYVKQGQRGRFVPSMAPGARPRPRGRTRHRSGRRSATCGDRPAKGTGPRPT